MASTTEGTAPRLSREDWIDGTLDLLASHSVDSVRLDVLCKRLGVTTGSFYWHFGSREDLIDAVLDTWHRRTTIDIARWLHDQTGTPVDRLRRLFKISIASRPDVAGGPLEQTLRGWARRDARVHKLVKTVDAERLAIVKQLYLDVGLADEQAEDHALLHLAYVTGSRMMLPDATPAELARRRRIAERYLLGDVPVAAKADKTALR